MGQNFEIIQIQPYLDKRGKLKKIIKASQLPNGEQIGEVYFLFSNQGSVRGNHYHEKTLEYFTTIAGAVRVAIKDLDTGVFQDFQLSEEDNLILKVPARIIHAFKTEANEPSIMVAVSTREYHPTDHDTFPMQILE